MQQEADMETAGACVRVCLVRPPHAPSLRRWPQLSTLVRDHRGKNLCFREVGCLGAQIQPKLSLEGRVHGGSGGAFPSQMRSVELLLDWEGTFPGAGVRPRLLLIHSLPSFLPSTVATWLAQDLRNARQVLWS